MSKDKTEDLSNLDRTSKRLKYLIDNLGVKQSHMAKKIGLSASGLHYILNNDVKYSKNAKKIEAYVNKRWKEATGHLDHNNLTQDDQHPKVYSTPIFYPDQLKLQLHPNQNRPLIANNYYHTDERYAHETIAMYITDHDFAPKFEISDTVLFEKTTTFSQGEIVLVYLANSNQLTIKYASHIDNNIILTSKEGAPLKLSPDNGGIIIGCYRECRKKSNINNSETIK